MKTKEDMAVDANFSADVKDSLIRLQEAESRIEELEKKLDIAVEALEFYGNKKNWEERWISEDPECEGDVYDVISREDVKIETDDIGDYLTYGGAKASEALAKIRGEK